MRTETDRTVELAERVEALLDELDEQLDLYSSTWPEKPELHLTLALEYVAGRHDLRPITIAQLRELHRARRRQAAGERRALPWDRRGPAEITD